MYVHCFFVFFFEGLGDLRDLHVLTHSFPTRRSSDLPPPIATVQSADKALARAAAASTVATGTCMTAWVKVPTAFAPSLEASSSAEPLCSGVDSTSARRRSEEHTSEPQSLMRISYAVFCLKKKNKHTRERKNNNHHISENSHRQSTQITHTRENHIL